MPYVIGKACIGTKDTACVEVCPVDCIHPKKEDPGFDASEQLYIDPDVCIDCGVCEPECPVEAIYAGDSVPAEEEPFILRNADFYKLTAAEFQAKYGVPGRQEQ
jgi:NAD-dependent dihydropyrimidine dehydrogenase PreA subunit